MTEQAADKSSRETALRWLDVLDRAEARGYEPLVSLRDLGDAKGVENESRAWAARFFSPGASPYVKGTRVVRAVHAATSDTFDVLRHEYTALGLDLAMFETAGFAVLRIVRGGDDILALRPRDRIEAVHEVAERVLATRGVYTGRDMQERPYHWRFLFPAGIVEGGAFTTNPDANANWLWSWAERADGGITGGRLYFVLYKQREATDGRIVMLNMAHWFDGKCWEPYKGPARR